MACEVENFLAKALLQAVETEDFKCAMSLMENNKANPYHVVKGSGIAPLHFAVCMTNETSAIYFVKFFLKHSGDPNVKTDDGETSLHIACYYGRMKIVELLVINGGDIAIKDNDGNTPLNITINEGHFEIFEMLKQMIFEAKEKKRSETVPSKIDDPDRPARLTLNRMQYDMDCASPYYVNITRRKPKPTAVSINNHDTYIVEEQANIFQLNESNLMEFQKVNQRLSKKSLVNTWKEKLVNTATNYDEMLQEFNNLQFSSTKLDFELDWTNEMTNQFSNNIKTSSTKLPQELAANLDAGYDSFHTAKSGDKSPTDGTFIKSPNRLGNSEGNLQESQVQLVEDYRHNDRENGVVFYERKIEPSISRSNKSDSQTTASSKFTVPSDYNTVDLRRELTQFGDSPGPITKSTKYLYMKRLMKFKRHPELVNTPTKLQSKSSYSIELEKTLKSDSWQDTLKQYAEMELQTKMVDGFQSEFSKGNGDDCLKKSFMYILIDPTISENLPGNAKYLEPLEAWKRFILSIFYIGKGTCSRPYSHLYDAIKMYQQLSGNSEANRNSPWTNKIKETEKLKRIHSIWKADKGVICLNVFHNITGAEAFCREACVIDAIGLENLTNLKRGEYHGLPKTWPMRDRKQLGAVLLFKSFKIYLSEGESQLRPNHIKS